jgi:hypothetical protein
MEQRSFASDVTACRGLMDEVQDPAEKNLLLRIACEFERLDRIAECETSAAEQPFYYAQRAAQEVTAAVKAQHPKARLAHLSMAQRYDCLANLGQR